MQKKAVIIGATSGIGRALAFELHSRGYIIGITGRRVERLEEIHNRLQQRVYIQFTDITDLENTFLQIEELLREMGGMDIIVLNAGVSDLGKDAPWEKERNVIDVNIKGFSALAHYAFDYFEDQGNGHLVGISSISAFSPNGLAAAYCASKAYVNSYLQGYRQKANHSESDIAVTTVIPGFVKSEMTEGMKATFWEADTGKAASQIADDIYKRKNRSYITRRWALIAWLLKLTPNWIFDRL